MTNVRISKLFVNRGTGGILFMTRELTLAASLMCFALTGATSADLITGGPHLTWKNNCGVPITRVNFGGPGETPPSIFANMPNGAPISNDLLRPLGFQLFSASGAGFSRISSPDSPDPGIRANDNLSNFELRFTTPVRGLWTWWRECRAMEVRLGDTLVGTLPVDIYQGIVTSDPSITFDRIIFRPNGASYPNSKPSIGVFLDFAPVPGPSAWAGFVVARLIVGARRRTSN